MKPERITVAMTGASGAQYGLRLLELLTQAGVELRVLISQPAQVVIGMETDFGLPARPAVPGQISVYGREQWTAPVASGSGVSDAMVVCPCTTGTLAAIASGQSRNLIERAADVSIKERRPLILVVRETPFSSIHLENMLRLSQAGVTIMPANPGFYYQPTTVEQIIDFMVARVLDHLGVSQTLVPPWGEPNHD
jgi:flavin prenyltransferase